MNPYQRLRTWSDMLQYRWYTERAELNYVLRRPLDEGSLFDVGAYRGVYSYWLHRRFPSAQIVAFEPQPELVEFLRKFQTAFRLERLHIEPVGLSSRAGRLRMHRPRKQWTSATVDEFCLDDDEMESFEVAVTTLDEYIAGHPELRPVRFIKCDVEYHESHVLAGAERTLLADRPELLVEWSTPRRSYREPLFRLMQRLDYTIYQFEYGRLVPCTSAERHNPPSWELGAHYVFLPRERAVSVAA